MSSTVIILGFAMISYSILTLLFGYQQAILIELQIKLLFLWNKEKDKGKRKID
jgi:hypothetical protein